MEKTMTQESDRISQLPMHMVDGILSRLPIKDAGRTSILSRKWRHVWSFLPYLSFDNQCVRNNPDGQPSESLVKMIDRVLMLHRGPIQRFVLSHEGFSTIRDVDHWILHLSSVSIKEIILYIYTAQKYKIPACLFNCQDLVDLRLYGCSANISSSFKGFKNLQTLYLHRVELSPHGLETLISRCPWLKHLTLKDLVGIARVNVKAHNLESLDIGGAFFYVSFGMVNPLNPLKTVTLGFNDNVENGQGFNDANRSNLHRFFRDIHNIEILRVENFSLKYWALGNVPQTLPHALVHLKYLSTHIDFSSKEQILTVICLIRSSPQLKKVEFHRQSRPENQQTTGIATMADFWKHHSQSCCLEQVQVVSMRNICGHEPEHKFIKFLLTSLPNLQTMTVRLASLQNQQTSHLTRLQILLMTKIQHVEFLSELLRFRRASARAKVILL